MELLLQSAVWVWEESGILATPKYIICISRIRTINKIYEDIRLRKHKSKYLLEWFTLILIHRHRTSMRTAIEKTIKMTMHDWQTCLENRIDPLMAFKDIGLTIPPWHCFWRGCWLFHRRTLRIGQPDSLAIMEPKQPITKVNTVQKGRDRWTQHKTVAYRGKTHGYTIDLIP